MPFRDPIDPTSSSARRTRAERLSARPAEQSRSGLRRHVRSPGADADARTEARETRADARRRDTAARAWTRQTEGARFAVPAHQAPLTD